MGKLVRIEVENFKSYKGHQTIGPFHQFTSVIGPNGAGKSNLMDAISFVLGVHSTHLRSQNLKDMIYRPSALTSDEPESSAVGRSSLPRRAHVMAVYQDDRGREIKFMRIVLGTGQSEYRINDKQVPYAQYNTALEKENILVNAKNFLVFQGDVESVASQNPKDLTRLIEKICGSWEYKERYDQLKLEQERAIENSAHAFNKKRGVTAEIKQYQEQKIEAEKFEAQVRERRELIVQYLLWKLYHVEKKTHLLEEEANGQRIAANGASGEQAELEQSFKSARKEQALVHKELTKRELQIKKIKRELDEQRPASIGLMEKVEHIEKRTDKTKQAGNRVQRDFEQQTRAVQSLEESLTMLDESEKEYNATIPESGFGKGPILTSSQLADYEQRKQQVSHQAVEEQQQLQTLQRKRKMFAQNVEHQQSKLDQLQASESQFEAEKRQVMEDGNALTAEAQKVGEQLEARKSDLADLEQQRQTIQQREIELNEKLQDTLNKLMEAKADCQESDKEARFRESLSMMKQIFPGVHGKLADLCRPIQRKYDGAVATALGRHLDAIVVEDQKTAVECIQYMREQCVGTATFLPLETLTVPSINDRFRSYCRGAHLAIDVIKCNAEIYLPAVQYACGNTLICDSLAIAKQICFQKMEDVKTVTLDSTIIHRTGLMTGGQSTTRNQTRWGEQDVEGLMRTRDKFLAELNLLSKTKRMGSAEESARSDCAAMQHQLEALKNDITTLERKLEGINGSLHNIKQTMEQTTILYNEAASRLESIDAEIKQLEDRVAVVEDQVFGDFCAQIGVPNIRVYETLHFGLPEQVRERRSQFSTQRSRLETQLTFEREQLTELEERLAKLTKTLQDDEASREQMQRELTSLSERKEQMDSSLTTIETELADQTRLEEEKQQEINTLRRELESKGRDVDTYMKEMAKIEAKIEKIHAERVAIFRKCKLEDIELPLSHGTMDDILMEDTPHTQSDSSSMDIDEEPSQRSIRSTDWVVQVNFDQLGSEQRNSDDSRLEREFQDEIKARGETIDRMAPNLKAIDRLEGVEQRLRGAEEEFEAARSETKKAKERFNTVKRERYTRFYDAFSHVSEKIDLVYKELTKNTTFPLGGTAYLSLEDSDEPYLEGIKYHAMPPMKRFRDMEQLSGGEKSLAALALLFAIHSYRPSPFFVLDEVDAALDNTNVTKIANYIREHASDSFQFIVISLKNTLYEKAQSLVGIYRDKDVNSSKTLTLMLDQYQDASQVA